MAHTPPTVNFCPRCGQALADRLAFGRMRRVCSGCGFVFFREPKVAAGVLIEREGAVLLVRRRVDPKDGFWALPAGYMEIDEGPVACAMRECLEETGLIVRVTDLFGVYHITSDPRGPGVLILYRAEIVGGALKPGDDASELAFFTPDRMPREIAFASTRRALVRWCAGQKKAGG